MGNKVAGVDVLVSIKQNSDIKVIGGQSGATLNRETNIIEVTSKDANGWAESVGGVKSWSVECEGFLVENDESITLLESIWENNQTIDVSIAMPSGKKYEGTAIIESIPMEMPQDDAVSLSISLTGTGALQTVAAPALPAAATMAKTK